MGLKPMLWIASVAPHCAVPPVTIRFALLNSTNARKAKQLAQQPMA